jgi:glutamate/tyrosine decarboxylase-like PLP-dependent enzyme
VPELAPHVRGTDRADSITVDAHKAFSVPMGAGMLLTPDPTRLATAFRVRAGYMPARSGDDPYAASMQWSRRFTGLKLLLTLAVAGRRGYEALFRHQMRMADALRRGLLDEGWALANETPLPLVCFDDRARRDGRSAAFLRAVAEGAMHRENVWLSVARLATGARVLRACITSYRTEEADVQALVRGVSRARADIPAS